MKFNERLLDLRKKKGWSQEELGYKLDVSRQTISKWEAGQTTPELEKLRNLAKIFGISVDELISEEDNFKENINTEAVNKKSSNKGKSKALKYIKRIISLILFSIIIIYVIIVINRINIIRNIERILMETIQQYKYMNIEKYEYLERDEVFPSNSVHLNFQLYDKDNKHFERASIREETSDSVEKIEYYDSYEKENAEWKYLKVNSSNKTYYLNRYDQPLEHRSAVYNIKIWEEYRKNYNINIERLDINDFIMALNLGIKIANVDNEIANGYFISNQQKPYQNHCEILVDTTAKTICLEKIIYDEDSKDYKKIERYRYKYNDNYVVLEEIQPPELAEYTLLEYVEE